MSKKDYEMFARLIKQSIERSYSVDLFAQLLARELATDNPAFSRDRFLRACGIHFPQSRMSAE